MTRSERAAATSGHAVLASGITVLIAMAGMLLTGSKVFDSIGVGAMLVVFTAMVGSLTVLPALLGRLGDKVEKGRVRRPQSRSRVWNAVLRPVMRWPLPSALVADRPARGTGAADAWSAHHAARPGRPAAQHPGGAQLREDPEGLPGEPDTRGGGRPRPRSASRGQDARRDRPVRAAGAGQRSGRAADPGDVSTATATDVQILAPLVGNGSDNALVQAHSRRCATGSFRPASASCRARRSRSPGRPRARTISTL